MLDRVLGTLSRYNMCVPGEHVAVAVSGGADSVCLLHVLVELAPRLGITLSVAHLNHKLRGPESEADAAFAGRLAAGLGLPFTLREVDIAAVSGNLEQEARRARHAFFESLPAARIATGHTLSDQAETVLYRIARGSGTAGLAGALPVVDRRIRPLLDCTRAAVLEYLRDHGLAWREDASNTDVTFGRNRIRHEIIPLLRQVCPGVEDVLARTALVAREEEIYWNGELDRWANRLFRRRNEGMLLKAGEIAELPLAVQRRILRRSIMEVKGNLREIGIAHVDGVMELAAQNPGHGRLQMPGIDVFRSFEWLRIAPLQKASRWDRDYLQLLTVPGYTRIPGQPAVLRVSSEEYNTGGGRLDAAGLDSPLQLRNWHPGDHFTRPGRDGEKIKTLFQLARIPVWERHGWPVITHRGHIVWTRHFGVSAEYIPAEDSRRILHIVEYHVAAE